MKHEKTTIVWLRNDLRLTDNPALFHAAEKGHVIPVFIWSPEINSTTLGAASKWWLHHSLQALQTNLKEKGCPLILRMGYPQAVLSKLAEETEADAIYWNRRYEPTLVDLDIRAEKELSEQNIEVKTWKANLLAEPIEIQNQMGLPFQIFTPFWKHCLKKLNPDEPLPSPRKLTPASSAITKLQLEDLALLPKEQWYREMNQCWNPGETGAMKNLQSFVKSAVKDYRRMRNFPALPGTSKLSPHLHFGEISPRQVWYILAHLELPNWKESQFLSEIGWREFSYHWLHSYPHIVDTPFRPYFKAFPWDNNPEHLQAWQEGRTGYPIVDAGMRELWATGWMHNRVRMIAASFLVKHLLIDWRKGAEWFWDTLVDADLACNTQGWQWTAGCGADAAPYFRIFNPTSQSTKFDPDGNYIRKWVPELKNLDPPHLFEPWNAPENILARSGVQLGENYPYPIVDHTMARNRALAAYKSINS